MKQFNIFEKDSIVGLDIGCSSVHLARFARTEAGLRLIAAKRESLTSAGGKTPDEGEIVSALKTLFTGVDLKRSRVMVSIDCPHTAATTARVPFMPRSELREGILLEAKNFFPFPIGDSIIDYTIVGDVVERGVRKREIAVAVSPKATVARYLSLMEKAGIKPASFVPSSLALFNAASRSCAREGTNICCVDIGCSHTELLIVRGASLVFSRKIPVAGNDFTRAMAKTLVSERGKVELSFDEAEKMKREVGIPPEGDTRIIGDTISATQVLSMLRAPFEQLVSEIERCFDYFREESGGGTIDSIVLFGGGASLEGLIKPLSEAVGTEVKLGDAFQGIKAEPAATAEAGTISYRMQLAVGAALSDIKGVNLLPPEIKEEKERLFRRGTIEAAVTAAVIISILAYAGMRIQLGNFQRKITVAGKELQSLLPQLKKAEAYHLANIVLVNEPHWKDVFMELANLIPDDIYLTRISMEDRMIRIQGIVVSENGEDILSDFILTLENGMFRDVKLVRTKDLTGKPGNEFELTTRVD